MTRIYARSTVKAEPRRDSVMTRIRARSTAKAEPRKTGSNLASWVFISCTLLMLACLIRMWSHWVEISASLGFYQAACSVTAVTAAALIVSWWVNTGNE